MKTISGTSPLDRYTIADGATIEHGNLVMLNGDGNAIAGGDTAGAVVVGVAEEVIDNLVTVKSGVVALTNAAGDAALTREDRGSVVLVKGPDTVGKSSNAKIVGGICIDVYENEVYVAVDPVSIAAGKALLN